MANQGFPQAQTFTLNEVTQPDGASPGIKSIIQKPAGSVTAFAFEAGHGLAEHSAPCDVLVIATEGEMEITITGTKHKVSSGQAIIIPAKAVHSVNPLTKFSMLLVKINE